MTQLFYAYAVPDTKYRDQLERHLRRLKERDVISGWTSKAVGPGSSWRGEASPQAARADVVLLLMSSDLISSGYLHGQDATKALERQQRGEARVVPVLLRPCNLKGTPFSVLPALPRDGKPVSRWSSTEAAFQAIEAGIVALTRPAAAADEAAAGASGDAGQAQAVSATGAPAEAGVNGTAASDPADIALQPNELGPDFVAVDQKDGREEAADEKRTRFVSVARAGARRVAQLVYRAEHAPAAVARLEAAVRAEVAKGGQLESQDGPDPRLDLRRVRVGRPAPGVSVMAAKGRFLVAAKVVGTGDTDQDSAALADSVVRRMLDRIPD